MNYKNVNLLSNVAATRNFIAHDCLIIVWMVKKKNAEKYALALRTLYKYIKNQWKYWPFIKPIVFDVYTNRAVKTSRFIRNPTAGLSTLEWLLTFFDTRDEILLLLLYTPSKIRN